MVQHTSDPMSYLESIKQSSPEIKNAVSQLSQVFPNETINMRLVNWLWHYVRINVPENTLQEVNCGTPQGIVDLSNAIATNQLNYGTIRTLKNERIISEEYIKWILQEENQDRLKNWLRMVIIGRIDLNKFFDETLKLKSELIGDEYKNIEKIITIIDYNSPELSDKIALTNELSFKWDAFNKTEKIFYWFKKNDTESKLKTAHKWIWDNLEMIPQSGKLPISSSGPYFEFKSVNDLIIYFDNSTLDSAGKLLFIDRIKRKFNQEKYKESIKNKKQCNYVLKNETISTLEKISKITGKNRTEIIENLINEAYKKILSDSQK